jgi:hypothetical protein
MAGRTHLASILKALRFQNQSVSELEAIPERDWPALLHAMDRAHLTLALARVRDCLPELVRSRIDRNLADNRTRCERLLETQSQIADAFLRSGIDHVVLKGLAQWPWYTDDPGHRPQYDIDIYVPGNAMSDAAHALQTLGYSFAGDALDPGADHLPVMIRRTGWTWRDDYYDPEMPLSVELHFRFWNHGRMRFCGADFMPFWERRIARRMGNLRLNTLHPVDILSYSAMHLVRHLLNGDMRLRHVYETAHFLERSSTYGAFWEEWRQTALAPCRVMEGIAFRLARDWFHCDVHPAALEAIDRLPPPVQRWFSLFGSPPAWSPSTATGGSGKNEIWLHFCLLANAKDKRDVAMRRLFPRRRMRVHLNPHVPPSKVGFDLRVRRRVFEVSFMARRLFHHVRVLAPTLHGAFRWRFAHNAAADRRLSAENAQP